MIVPRYLSYDEIGDRAAEFLEKYHPSLELPIPIERIIEFDLGLDIVPMPNLHTDFRINGFLSADCSSVYVDETQYLKYPEKYRFTLAHEVAHMILHSDSYKEVIWKNLDEYIDGLMNMERESLDRFEVQGNLFAEQVLVPERELLNVIAEVSCTYDAELVAIGASARGLLPYISRFIAKPFEVSPSVIECRLNHMEDGLSLLVFRP